MAADPPARHTTPAMAAGTSKTGGAGTVWMRVVMAMRAPTAVVVKETIFVACCEW